MTTQPHRSLGDKTILITGAGSGLGRASALDAAAQGATIILLDKQLKPLEAVYDEIEAAGGAEPAIYPMNLEGATPKDYEDLATKLDEIFGGLDGLVHNAATLPYLTRVKDHEANDWARCLQVNLTAPFLLTQVCWPLLERRPGASILFISDQCGREPRAFWGAYGVSKFGLEGLAGMLAEESEQSPVRVNTLDPGPMSTPLRRSVYPGEQPGDQPDPATVAPLVSWLLSDSAREIRGRQLRAADWPAIAG